MEVSRVLMSLVKTGWRPRRTIIFCSWGAEEHGLVGSYEWVEDTLKILNERVVSYLNVDIAVQGGASLRARAIPFLYNVLYDVAKRLPAANTPSKTMFDEWVETFPSANDPQLPNILSMGSGSDFAAFIGVAGVPCLDIRYTHNYPIIDYPLYHSVYETFHLVDTHIDPDYKYSTAIGRFWAETARYLADSLVLPLNASQYSHTLKIFIADLKEGYGTLMRDNGITFDDLDQAAEEFHLTTNDFMTRILLANKKHPLEIRMMNDQLIELERAFIVAEGLPDRPLQKHVLFAPSSFNSYAGDTFPGLVDLMWEIEKRSEDDQIQQWERVKHHLSVIIYSINSAVKVLKPVIQFN